MFVTYIFYDTKRCCLSPQISIWFTAYEVGDLHGCSKGYVTLAPVMATLYVCMIILLLENPWFIAGVQNSYISAYMWEYMFNEKQVSPTLPVSVGYRKKTSVWNIDAWHLHRSTVLMYQTQSINIQLILWSWSVTNQWPICTNDKQKHIHLGKTKLRRSATIHNNSVF